MEFEAEAGEDARVRLARIEGQIRGLQRMLEGGEDCKKILTQLAAASSALERVSFRLFASGMHTCLAEGSSGIGVAEMEELFVKLH